MVVFYYTYVSNAWSLHTLFKRTRCHGYRYLTRFTTLLHLPGTPHTTPHHRSVFFFTHFPHYTAHTPPHLTFPTHHTYLPHALFLLRLHTHFSTALLPHVASRSDGRIVWYGQSRMVGTDATSCHCIFRSPPAPHCAARAALRLHVTHLAPVRLCALRSRYTGGYIHLPVLPRTF